MPDVEDVPALLARVRTAEAEAAKFERWWKDAEREVKRAHRQEVERAALNALASRTVETAEEWEYGRADSYADVPRVPHSSLGSVEYGIGVHGGVPMRRRPAGPWEPVPPIPKTGCRGTFENQHGVRVQCWNPRHGHTVPPTPEEA